MKSILKFLLVFLLSVGVAQATTISGTVTVNNVALPNGSLQLSLLGCPNPLVGSSGGPSAALTYKFTLDPNGHLPLAGVTGNDVIYCSGVLGNTYYELKAYNATGGLLWDRYYRITGTAWNLNTATVLTNFGVNSYVLTNPPGDQIISVPTNNRLTIAGGETLVQDLYLGQDPTVTNQAATKYYVDQQIAAVTSSTNTDGKVNRSGDTMTGPFYLANDPLEALQAATKQYVDNDPNGTLNVGTLSILNGTANGFLYDLAGKLGNTSNILVTDSTGTIQGLTTQGITPATWSLSAYGGGVLNLFSVSGANGINLNGNSGEGVFYNNWTGSPTGTLINPDSSHALTAGGLKIGLGANGTVSTDFILFQQLPTILNATSHQFVTAYSGGSAGTFTTAQPSSADLSDTGTVANWNTSYTDRIATFTTTGTSGAATFSGNTLNIPVYSLSGLGGLAANGSVTGATTQSQVFTDGVTLSNLSIAGYVTNTSGGILGTVATIPNAGLTNSTISGIALGSNLYTLTFGTHLTSGDSSYNGAAAKMISIDATSANTASTVVARDGSNNFSAGTITAALNGNATNITASSNTSLTSLVNLVTVGTIGTGAWQGTAVADAYIASSSSWNTAYSNRIATFTTTGSSGAATFSGNTLNIPNYTLSGLGGLAASGTVTGATSQSQVFTDGVTLSNITAGSVLFAGASGVLSQDNSNFFWDATNHRLGIGTSSCPLKLCINGNLDAYAQPQSALPSTSVVPNGSGVPNYVTIMWPFEYVSVQGVSKIYIYNISTGTQVAASTPSYTTSCTSPSGMALTNINGVEVMAVVCYDTGALLTLTVNTSTGALTSLGSVSGLTAPYPGLVIDGTNVYVPEFGTTSVNGSIAQISIATPSSPSITTSVQLAQQGTNYENPAYITSNAGYIFVEAGSETGGSSPDSSIQVINETTMTLVGTPLGVDHSPQSVAKLGTTLFVSIRDNPEIYSIDISNPASLSVLQKLTVSSCLPLPVAVDARYLYVGCDSTGGIQLYDVSNPSNMQLLNTFTGFTDVQRLAFAGPYLAITDYATGGNVYLANTQRSFLLDEYALSASIGVLSSKTINVTNLYAATLEGTNAILNGLIVNNYETFNGPATFINPPVTFGGGDGLLTIDTNADMTFTYGGSSITFTVNNAGGSVSTLYNTLDDGSGNTSIHGTLTMNSTNLNGLADATTSHQAVAYDQLPSAKTSTSHQFLTSYAGGSAGTFTSAQPSYSDISGSVPAITSINGDGAASGPGSAALTLSTVNSSPGPCGDAMHVCVITTDGKGRVTLQSATAITATSPFALTFATTGGVAPTGTYNGGTAVTIDYSSLGAAGLAAANTFTAANTFPSIVISSTSGTVLTMGNTSGISTTNPISIDMGGTYSSVAGANAKLKLYDGSGAVYGLGVSSNQMDLMVPAGGWGFYVAGSLVASLNSSNFTAAAFNGVALNTSAGSGYYLNGAGSYTQVTYAQLGGTSLDLAIANNLSDLNNATTARTNLGLGTAATQNTGASGATIPLLNGNWTASGTDTFTNTLIFKPTSGLAAINIVPSDDTYTTEICGTNHADSGNVWCVLNNGTAQFVSYTGLWQGTRLTSGYIPTDVAYVDVANTFTLKQTIATTALDESLVVSNSTAFGTGLELKSTLSGELADYTMGANINASDKDFGIYDLTNNKVIINYAPNGAGLGTWSVPGGFTASALSVVSAQYSATFAAGTSWQMTFAGGTSNSGGIRLSSAYSAGSRDWGFSTDELTTGDLLLQVSSTQLGAPSISVLDFTVAGAAKFFFPVTVPSLTQPSANSFAGSCSMSGSTSCTFTISATYTSYVCFVTLQGTAPSAIDQDSCSVSGNTVTIYSATTQTNTYAALVIGNPN
jgi:LVIVD repeat-containing protein